MDAKPCTLRRLLLDLEETGHTDVTVNSHDLSRPSSSDSTLLLCDFHVFHPALVHLKFCCDLRWFRRLLQDPSQNSGHALFVVIACFKQRYEVLVSVLAFHSLGASAETCHMQKRMPLFGPSTWCCCLRLWKHLYLWNESGGSHSLKKQKPLICMTKLWVQCLPSWNKLLAAFACQGDIPQILGHTKCKWCSRFQVFDNWLFWRFLCMDSRKATLLHETASCTQWEWSDQIDLIQWLAWLAWLAAGTDLATEKMRCTCFQNMTFAQTMTWTHALSIVCFKPWHEHMQAVLKQVQNKSCQQTSIKTLSN